MNEESMKYFNIILLAMLAIAFYAQGIFSENSIFIWGGHLTTFFTVVYGYFKLIWREEFRLSTTGRKVYSIFDLIVTLGLFYFLFQISYFESYSSVESFFLITAIVIIIVVKIIYYYRKEFATQVT